MSDVLHNLIDRVHKATCKMLIESNAEPDTILMSNCTYNHIMFNVKYFGCLKKDLTETPPKLKFMGLEVVISNNVEGIKVAYTENV